MSVSCRGLVCLAATNSLKVRVVPGELRVICLHLEESRRECGACARVNHDIVKAAVWIRPREERVRVGARAAEVHPKLKILLHVVGSEPLALRARSRAGSEHLTFVGISLHHGTARVKRSNWAESI